MLRSQYFLPNPESLKISCEEIEEQPSSLPDEGDIKLAFLSHKMYNLEIVRKSQDLETHNKIRRRNHLSLSEKKKNENMETFDALRSRTLPSTTEKVGEHISAI